MTCIHFFSDEELNFQEVVVGYWSFVGQCLSSYSSRDVLVFQVNPRGGQDTKAEHRRREGRRERLHKEQGRKFHELVRHGSNNMHVNIYVCFLIKIN